VIDIAIWVWCEVYLDLFAFCPVPEECSQFTLPENTHRKISMCKPAFKLAWWICLNCMMAWCPWQILILGVDVLLIVTNFISFKTLPLCFRAIADYDVNIIFL